MTSAWRALLTALILVAGATAASAQSSISEDTLDTLPNQQAPDIGFRSGSLIAVPIPFSNPTIGSGLAAGVGWLFTADEGSQSSSLGFGGFKSDNGSRGLAFSTDLNLRDNRYILSVLAGSVDLNYDFTAGPADIPLEQSGELYKIELSYGITPDFSVGLGFRYAETEISTNFAGPLPPEIQAAADLNVFKIGVVAEWDTRDSDIYPTRGILVSLDVFQGDVTGGLGQDYQKGVLQWSRYEPGFGTNSAFALSGTLCHASSTAPFFDSCSIGLTDGLRGFSATQYIGSSLASAQVEYRGRIGSGRFGYAAFAAAGLVSGTLTSQSGLNAAVGTGLRYRVSQSYPVDLAVDVTYNSDDETLYYVYVGQSF